MKNNTYESIAVIYGSDSSEWEVSVRSGQFTASQIDGNKYDVYEVFARFGQWSVAAYRKKGQERVAFAEGEQPVVDKSDFSAVVAPIYAQIRINALENARLKALRDSLLPKLISGEIDVSDIQI